MRLFIAIGASDLNFDPKEALKKLKVNLNRKEIEYRWIPQENYHITLNFIGETTPEKLTDLKNMLDELSHRHAMFHLKIHGLGVFPTVKEGRVIWLDIQNSQYLRAMQEDCEEQLLKMGFEFETRSYTPHLTIARLRSPRSLGDMISPLVKHKFGEMEVKQLILYESKLGGSFPIYEPLFRYPLRERESQSEGRALV